MGTAAMKEMPQEIIFEARHRVHRPWHNSVGNDPDSRGAPRNPQPRKKGKAKCCTSLILGTIMLVFCHAFAIISALQPPETMDPPSSPSAVKHKRNSHLPPLVEKRAPKLLKPAQSCQTLICPMKSHCLAEEHRPFLQKVGVSSGPGPLPSLHSTSCRRFP